MAYKPYKGEGSKTETAYQDQGLTAEEVEQHREDEKWLELARDAFRTSTDYMDSSLRRQWEKNLSLFRSKHPSGSKYHSKAYRHRAKVFRPKTRSAITRNEAQAATAYFSTDDVVHVGPQNDNDQVQVLGAKLNNELLNYRLTEDIPWFLTCMGAFQDSMTIGSVVSKQYWHYEERVDLHNREMLDEEGNSVLNEDGSPVMEEVEVFEGLIADEPRIDLLPIENVRFDPAADWRDVVGTSPYWITLEPMYLGDVKAKMKQIDPKTGQPVWRQYDEGTILSAVRQDYDSVRKAREGNDRVDSKDRVGRSGDFQIVWIHENIIRQGNADYIYWTLGEEYMLTDPVPIESVYIHGRPYVMGHCTIETHKTAPAGSPEIWEGLQTEANDVANQRLDNVRLVLNSRYFVKRSANVDTRSLVNSVPGGVTLMDDVMQDIKPDRPGDVTGSAYQEQDRLNVDFDEIAGSFSPGSVQTNRQLNETVGGMEMLSADSNALTAYRLRIFTETWVEPVLRHLVKLEQAYETDETVLTIAGQKSGAFEQLGIQRIPDQLIEQPVSTRVNVGIGATNPDQRIKKLMTGIQSTAAAMQIPGINVEEVQSEIFGALGYKDGARFFVKGEDGKPADPEKMQMMQTIQQLEQQLQGKQMETQAKMQIEQMRQQATTQRDMAKIQANMQLEQFKGQLAQVDKQLKAAELKGRNEIEIGKLINQRQALLFQMQQKQADIIRQNKQDRLSQVYANDEYGMIPDQRG